MRTIRATLAAAMMLGLLLSSAALDGAASAQPYPPPVGSLSAQSSTTTPPVGGTTTLTAVVLDISGTPVAGAEVLFQIESQPGTDARFSNGLTQITALTDSTGTATIVLSVGNTPGTIIIKMISGDKTSQLTLQAQSAPAVPITGGPPPSEGGGLTAWQAVLIAAAAAVLLAGGVTIVARRRA